MTIPSVEQGLLNGSFSVISALGLTYGDTPATTVLGKLPKLEPNLENVPLIYVSCSQKSGRAVLWDTGTNAFGGACRKKHEYILAITMIAKSNRDPLAGLFDYTYWRQQIARSLTGNPTQVGLIQSGADVYDTIEEPGPTIDRPAWVQNYDHSLLDLRYTVIETAQN